MKVFDVALPVLRRERLDLRLWSTRWRTTATSLLRFTEPVERMDRVHHCAANVRLER